MSDHNGNGNGHSNGHEKPFVLAKQKTPEEIQRESILATMPKLRRHCSKDVRLRRLVGAKWLFAQISDLTFLNTYGGDGFGKIYISIKDLHRIFGHDVHSLTKWRDKLIETGWIWVREMWPKSEWGITGISRQPDLFPVGSDFMQQMAKASGKESHPSNGHSKWEETPTSGGSSPPDSVKRTHSQCEGITPSVGNVRTDNEYVPTGSEGNVPTESVKGTHPEGVRLPLGEGMNPSGQGEGITHIRKPPSVKLESGESSLSVQRNLNAQNGRGGKSKTGTENIFLLDVRAMMERWRKGSGNAELKNSGAWWRLAFRHDPELMRRVLADVVVMVKEGRIKETPGQAAVNLAQNWGLPELATK
jgi:hypothetical protein